MNFLDVSAASQIVEKELFVLALYLYSESGKVTLSPCFVLNFAWVMLLFQFLHAYTLSMEFFWWKGGGRGVLHIFYLD